MSLGPLILDLAGTKLTTEESERLRHPLVGGVILFSRNYASPSQLDALVKAIHSLREPRLLVSVDHEGGRVQRFQEAFTRLPAVSRLGEIYDHNRRRAKRLAELTGWLMATELRSVGIDFSYAPVLDLGRGISQVIGDRAFHADPEVVADLGHSYMLGMARAGMAAVGKHFPGHGSSIADSHVAVPVDERDLEDIALADLVPFERMIHFNLPAVMPAHIIYPRVDKHPAGFSRIWLQHILRGRLGFQGLIISDDLSMAGAGMKGDLPARAKAALTAGCDMILVCNDPDGVDQVLKSVDHVPDPAALSRMARVHGHRHQDWQHMQHDPVWQEAVIAVTRYGAA